jgi:hypothetical protein
MVTDLQFIWHGDYATLLVTTDVPTTLTMRRTTVPFRMHKRTSEQRGLVKLEAPDFCFVQFDDCPQDQIGDTRAHTFTFCPFAYCITYYFTFVATIGGAVTRSNTAIFQAHNDWPAPPTCNMPGPELSVGLAEDIPLPLSITPPVTSVS